MSKLEILSSKSVETILIVAHPDDEVLFANSVLEDINRIIFCYGPIPGENELSNCRLKALKNYPLNRIKIENLNVKQSKDSFLPINWLDTSTKGKEKINGRGRKNYQQISNEILQKLLSTLPHKSIVITHNPWGEYGHVDHIQLFNVIRNLQSILDLKIFVTGYVSSISRFYAKTVFNSLIPKPYLKKTNTSIYELLKDHYQKYGCWTWFDDYKLPEYESFYLINKSLILISNTNKGPTLPLNFIDMGNPLLFIIKNFIKQFVPSFIKRKLRLGRVVK